MRGNVRDYIKTPVAVNTSLTNLFAIDGLTTGFYGLQGEIFAAVTGAATANLTADFTGTTVGLFLNMCRQLASGGFVVVNSSAFGTSAASAWVYAKINGAMQVNGLDGGLLSIGATRVGSGTFTVHPGSYFEVVSD